MAILASVILLGGIGATGALILNRVSHRFHVEEDERISQLEDMLPGANCGACGYKGCHDFAVSCIKAGNIDGFYCPGAGADGMKRIADFMGCNAEIKDKKIAVVKCAGTPETKTPLNARYVGPKRCAIMALMAGDYACANSCLGCGDCVESCKFGAIVIDPMTKLPTVDSEKCTGCAACAAACPKSIIKMRPEGLRKRRVWVACSNCQKGAVTRKQCTVGCIGCGLCAKTCPFGAITVTNNLAYIDPEKCKTCGKCIGVCPTHAINSANVAVIPKKTEE